ncbi:MAG: alpha-L-fucosidase [Clostridiales bacterium]|nr:alpha-L-fucosidase [Clostridiales bacterium]
MDRAWYLAQIERVICEGKYKPNWASLAEHPIPEWYRQKRLGIFLHWGPFSIPAYHDWYARNMYIQGTDEYEHHLKNWGSHKDFGYQNFIPMLKMENYDPEEWVRLFREAGADYIVPVAEHHDGFQMYKSELSHWNAAEMGPHRDVMGELLTQADRSGMTVGASSHRVEHCWFFGNGKKFESDIPQVVPRDHLYWPANPEPENQHDINGQPAPDDEFMTDWLLRCCEIVDRYHPRILYFDWWIQHQAVKPYLMKFAAYYYNRAEEWGGCVINYKHDAFPFGCAVPDVERGQFSEVKPFLWQSDTSVMRGSWCYSSLPERAQHKEPKEIIWDLADVVAKNGRLLLNVGPKPDGTLAEKDVAILKTLGSWMKVNGEAIHGTGIWRYAQEGPTAIQEGQFADGVSRNFTSEDIRFTCKGDAVYAIALVCPEDGTLHIRSMREADASHLPLFSGAVKAVTVLGCDAPITWERDTTALTVHLGAYRSELPVVVKITVN